MSLDEIHLMSLDDFTSWNIISLDVLWYKAIDSSISQNIFSYNNIANFINMYANIYTYITCDEDESK